MALENDILEELKKIRRQLHPKLHLQHLSPKVSLQNLKTLLVKLE
jgi:hypothetical protein